MEKCFVCDGALVTVNENREIRIGARAAVVEHSFSQCKACGEEFFTPAEMDAVQSRASTVIRNREGLLHPEQIRSIREELGVSQRDFERLLGTGQKTVVRWERGTIFQSRTADNLMRLVAEFPSVGRWLAGRNSVAIPQKLSDAITDFFVSCHGQTDPVRVRGGAEDFEPAPKADVGITPNRLFRHRVPTTATDFDSRAAEAGAAMAMNA